MEPLRPIDVRLRREVDPVTPAQPVRLTPAERDAARERREQARKRRQQARPKPDPGDGHVDLTA
jgi:hypothetical protein